MADANGAQILPFGPGNHAPPRGHDTELDRVELWISGQTAARRRLGEAIRSTFDQVLDAERTGRYDILDLSEVERVYLLDRFRIVFRDEFDIPRGPTGTSLAFTIDGVGADVAFEPAAGWAVPMSAIGHVCLLVRASDPDSTYSIGLLRCDRNLIEAADQPGLVALGDSALGSARWVWQGEAMRANVLRSLAPVDVQAIFAQTGQRNGQARINVLFERVLGRVIPRDLIVAVAHQRDPMKRVRDARPAVQPLGIVILGHQKDHPRILQELTYEAVRKGEFVAVRLVRATPQRQRSNRAVVVIGGRNWVEALSGEPTEPGPEWPY